MTLTKDKREALEHLLERVKGAKGPDRELDASIWTQFLPYGPEGLCGFAPADGWHYEYEAAERFAGYVLEYAVNREGRRMPQACKEAPLFTASVDAALALVEREFQGWAIETEKWGVACMARLWECDSAGWHRGGTLRVESKAQTLPLAIIAATLSAKLETGREGE